MIDKFKKFVSFFKIGIRYGTPYKGRINFIIRQAQESGLIDKWERVNTMSEQKTQARMSSGSGLQPFSLLHLQTAFYLFITGCVTAISAFLSEIMYKYFVLTKKNVTFRVLSFAYVASIPVLERRGT